MRYINIRTVTILYAAPLNGQRRSQIVYVRNERKEDCMCITFAINPIICVIIVIEYERGFSLADGVLFKNEFSNAILRTCCTVMRQMPH